MIDDNCIFCKIGAGQIPTNKIYEDEVCMVFRDMEPLMPTHVLIIPKDHYRDLVNTGDDASQSVKHFHIHILGGGLMPRPNDQDWGAYATNAHKFYA